METATRRGKHGAADDCVTDNADADARVAAAAATLDATSERAEAILAESGEAAAMARPSICVIAWELEASERRAFTVFVERERKVNRKREREREAFFPSFFAFRAFYKSEPGSESFLCLTRVLIDREIANASLAAQEKINAPHRHQPREDGSVHRGPVAAHDEGEEDEEEEERR